MDSGRTIIGTTALGERHCAFAFSLLEKEYTHSLLGGDLLIDKTDRKQGKKEIYMLRTNKKVSLTTQTAQKTEKLCRGFRF